MFEHPLLQTLKLFELEVPSMLNGPTKAIGALLKDMGLATHSTATEHPWWDTRNKERGFRRDDVLHNYMEVPVLYKMYQRDLPAYGSEQDRPRFMRYRIARRLLDLRLLAYEVTYSMSKVVTSENRKDFRALKKSVMNFIYMSWGFEMCLEGMSCAHQFMFDPVSGIENGVGALFMAKYAPYVWSSFLSYEYEKTGTSVLNIFHRDYVEGKKPAAGVLSFRPLTQDTFLCNGKLKAMRVFEGGCETLGVGAFNAGHMEGVKRAIELYASVWNICVKVGVDVRFNKNKKHVKITWEVKPDGLQ